MLVANRFYLVSAENLLDNQEKGRHIPDYSMLKRIAHVLKLPVAYFYADLDELAHWIVLFTQLKNLNELKY